MHFQQADAQEAEERRRVVVLRQPGGFDDLEQGLVFVLDLVQPDAVDGLPEPLFGAVLHRRVVGPAPGVLVLAGRGGAVALFVERRVGGDEVHGFAVHTAQDIQVVHIVEDAVGEVLLGHWGAPLVCYAALRQNRQVGVQKEAFRRHHRTCSGISRSVSEITRPSLSSMVTTL